jgi:hypothetical protein
MQPTDCHCASRLTFSRSTDFVAGAVQLPKMPPTASRSIPEQRVSRGIADDEISG